MTIVRTNTPTLLSSSVHDQQDQRDLEELLEFIEGNQSGKKENNKKAEKKARQKQRKVCLNYTYCIHFQTQSINVMILLAA